MKKKPSTDVEMRYLLNRCLTIVHFMQDYADERMKRQFLDAVEAIVRETHAKGNVAGMRVLSRDINAMAKAMPAGRITELEAKLAVEFGDDLAGDGNTIRTIMSVLQERSIENEDDYRIVHEYLQDISTTDPFYDRIEDLNDILLAYHGGSGEV
ncbi:MAG: hypothetical protein J5I53_03715 [Bradyrhizobiaceae bacterium]|nr:hypothetical protein [Bradyrhizobiaceae bacterium]